jgi:hypothetical protein
MKAYNTQLGDPAPRNAAGWRRINAVHKPGPDGLSKSNFVRACEAGEIPVSVRRYGPRLMYVNVAEYEAWSGTRSGLSVPGDAQRANANLFS